MSNYLILNYTLRRFCQFASDRLMRCSLLACNGGSCDGGSGVAFPSDTNKVHQLPEQHHIHMETSFFLLNICGCLIFVSTSATNELPI